MGRGKGQMMEIDRYKNPVIGIKLLAWTMEEMICRAVESNAENRFPTASVSSQELRKYLRREQ